MDAAWQNLASTQHYPTLKDDRTIHLLLLAFSVGTFFGMLVISLLCMQCYNLFTRRHVYNEMPQTEPVQEDLHGLAHSDHQAEQVVDQAVSRKIFKTKPQTIPQKEECTHQSIQSYQAVSQGYQPISQGYLSLHQGYQPIQRLPMLETQPPDHDLQTSNPDQTEPSNLSPDDANQTSDDLISRGYELLSRAVNQGCQPISRAAGRIYRTLVPEQTSGQALSSTDLQTVSVAVVPLGQAVSHTDLPSTETERRDLTDHTGESFFTVETELESSYANRMHALLEEMVREEVSSDSHSFTQRYVAPSKFDEYISPQPRFANIQDGSTESEESPRQTYATRLVNRKKVVDSLSPPGSAENISPLSDRDLMFQMSMSSKSDEEKQEEPKSD